MIIGKITNGTRKKNNLGMTYLIMKYKYVKICTNGELVSM